ncbi:Tripartite DNA replication factor [Clonorchis sinensis]|uniref:DNA replication ATP-dependent helicase/nuclease n=1 Tax=Clonorchis sinensis TaxID=79923 RepID=A0A8T1MQH6_CLOSI|nr:Tripartite DNA replication factor [Clonorchis sinensis]
MLMTRQTKILGFFRQTPERPKSPLNPKSTVVTSTDFRSNSSALGDSSSFIIPGTPEPGHCSPRAACSSSPSLSARPALIPIHVNPGTSTPITSRKRVVHKRSSLTVRRQAELLEKHSVRLLPDIDIPNESEQMRADRQANAAAKLRRGNYDGLNYAPIDQVKRNLPVQAGEVRSTFSRRSHLLVSEAIAESNRNSPPIKRVPEHASDGIGKRLRLEENSMSLDSFPSPGRGVKRTIVKSETSNSVEVRLDTLETIALKEILDSMDSPNQIKTPVITSSSSSQSSTKPENSARGDSGQFQNEISSKASRQFTESREQQLGVNESLGQLDLSDWSPEYQPLVGSPQKDPECSLPIRPFYRGTVTKIDHTRSGTQVSLSLAEDWLTSTSPGGTGTCQSLSVDLLGSWCDTQLRTGDTIHIVPSSGSCSGQRTHLSIGDNNPASVISSSDHIPTVLIQHPDFLLSGTKLVSSFFCERRTVIEEFWSSFEDAAVEINCTDDRASPGRVMLIGSFVHELLQKLVVTPKPTKNAASQLISSILYRPDSILQMYGCGVEIDEMRSSLDPYVTKVLHWIELNCCNFSTGTCSLSSCTSTYPILHKVVNVEENFWSTKFGIKGRIDLSVLGHLPHPETPHTRDKRLSLIPIELKTGRPSYSIEHKGQVLLYLLMLLDRYGPTYTSGLPELISTANAGWLVYLQDDNITPDNRKPHPGLVLPQADSFRGLLQTRNRLVTHLWRLICSLLNGNIADPASWMPPMPRPTKQLRSCQLCPVQMACSLLDASCAPVPNGTKCYGVLDEAELHSVPQLLSSKRAHLNPPHLNFFMRWCTLLLLEYAHSDRLDAVIGRIVSSKTSSVKTAPDIAVRRLKVCSTFPVSDHWQTVLIPERRTSQISEMCMGVGEFVIVSSDDNRHVGLMLGTIVPFTHEVLQQLGDRAQLLLSAAVSSTPQTDCIVLQTDRDYLRSLIIDGAKPSFTATLSKHVVTGIRGILRHLNTCQKTAVLRVLMANHYVLIKGYPGTGKTETLASLLRVLIRLGQKVLVVAHTHSAVDNLLVRLFKSGEQKILRLGSTDRVNPELLACTFEHMLHQQTKSSGSTTDPIAFIRQCLEDSAVVGCTALAASGGSGAQHPALCRTRFDLILVDEASQLLLPTSIGALLCLRSMDESTDLRSRFVLVGDPHQLPPLVQSNEARKAGLDRSLFTHLLAMNEPESVSPVSTKSGCVVALNLQYRMNSPILRLANELSYSNAMKAVDASIANGTLADRLTRSVEQLVRVPDTGKIPSWLTRAVSAQLEDAALFLDTSQWHSPEEYRGMDLKFSNPTEAKLVVFLLNLLIMRGLLPEDVGVIAPHRSQVGLLRRLLTETPISNPADPVLSDVEVNTVDQFQGRDKRAIILSLTVCTHGRVQTSTSSDGPGRHSRTALLEDPARLTVALTRAKHKLLIIGCSGLEKGASVPSPANTGTLSKLFTLMHNVNSWEVLDPKDQSVLEDFKSS